MIERISSPLKTKEIIEKNNFYFKKNFGQNFLIDSNILDNIISAANITKDDFVLEIGPGIGSLTQYLAESAGKVVAVEIDNNLIPILKETVGGYDNLEIINEDILKLDINALVDEKNNGNPIKVVANLPYYITTPIIMELLEKKVNVESITVMVQREVAARMQATAGTKDYGALSVAVQFYSDAKTDFIVPPNCFMPRPTVDSAVITLNLLNKQKVEIIDQDFMFHIVKCAFGQRRKTLMNTLNNLGKLNISKEEITEAITSIGVSEKIRGEALTIQQFALLSDELYRRSKK
ncbi:MAG: 16S rRNA (adenine(1518)-N(6)/adenine(1519)-N(6))-dimethyltransferase RsmA [Anaerotignaceae bacterium]